MSRAMRSRSASPESWAEALTSTMVHLGVTGERVACGTPAGGAKRRWTRYSGVERAGDAFPVPGTRARPRAFGSSLPRRTPPIEVHTLECERTVVPPLELIAADARARPATSGEAR